MLGYCLSGGVAKNIFKFLVRIGDLMYPDCEYLWAGLQCDMISMHKGNKSWFSGLGSVCKRAQKNLFDPKLSLVLPSIVLPLNGWVALLDPWESQEEFKAINIYTYEVLGYFEFTTVTVGHAKRHLMYSIHSKLVTFLARHKDMNIF